MNIEVFCVCRRPPRWVADLTSDYQRRMPRDLKLSFTYLVPGHGNMTAEQRRDDEAKRVLKRLSDGTPLVALDESGEQGTSKQLANWLAGWRAGHTKLALVIGGADGLGAPLLSRAIKRWSLSRLTLPHLLVQVVLAEQLYRAWTIIDGHPYHRG